MEQTTSVDLWLISTPNTQLVALHELVPTYPLYTAVNSHEERLVLYEVICPVIDQTVAKIALITEAQIQNAASLQTTCVQGLISAWWGNI